MEKETKITDEKCIHSFQLAKIEIETESSPSSSLSNYYKKIAYVICEKCGLILKQNI